MSNLRFDDDLLHLWDLDLGEASRSLLPGDVLRYYGACLHRAIISTRMSVQ
jgi:hypothetical protein